MDLIIVGKSEARIQVASTSCGSSCAKQLRWGRSTQLSIYRIGLKYLKIVGKSRGRIQVVLLYGLN
jgi:hypothetical protein